MSRNHRDSIVAKIKALLSKTVENGATEQEALAAAAKAAELMARHDLGLEDIDVRESDVRHETREIDPCVARHFPKVSAAIASLCEVERWTVLGQPMEEFLGLEMDVAVAVYLARICERAMVDALKRQEPEWMLYELRRRNRLRDSFVDGMAERLADRISEIAWRRRKQATGTGLVPVKDAKIKEEMEKKGISIFNSRIGNRDRDLATFLVGKAEAEKVQLEAGIKAEDGKDALVDQGLR